MGIEINLNKECFDKKIYNKTIDTSFNQLGLPPIIQVDPPQSVDIFFKLYNTLFYQIPELGETNSHEYIVKTSGEYIAFDKKDELVRALEKEIADTRKKLFQSQQDLTKIFPEEEIEPLPEIDDVELPPRVAPPLNIIPTPPPLPPPPPVAPTPPPPASATDQEMYDAGYAYQVVTYNALVNNINVLNDAILSSNIGNLNNWTVDKRDNMIKDIRQAKENGNTKVGDEGTYKQWRAAIKAKSSGNKKDNLYIVLTITTDKLRQTFKETNKFGDGFLSTQEFALLNQGLVSTSGYSSFN
jgi:hypothetical protein